LSANPNRPYVPANLLSILERLTTFPTNVAEINSWWVEELGTKPPKPKVEQGDQEVSDDENMEDDLDDWRKFFDDQDKSSTSSGTAPKARLHKLSIHQSLHSLASHRTVFTRTWLTLLPRLQSSKELSARALNVMHRGVMPHLTRPVLVMDWVGACVDFGLSDAHGLDPAILIVVISFVGGTVGLLGLNALFILMTEYNLYALRYVFLSVFRLTASPAGIIPHSMLVCIPFSTATFFM
jgi:U3 small nucleolar RNA-associated protein 19